MKKPFGGSYLTNEKAMEFEQIFFDKATKYGHDIKQTSVVINSKEYNEFEHSERLDKNRESVLEMMKNETKKT